jgi:hypothetical protein
MPKEFQSAYHETVMPALLEALDDEVPRVQAHACAAITNFFEHASAEIVRPHTETVCNKLCALI